MNALVMISGLGVIAMIAGIFRITKGLLPLVILGLLATLGVNLLDWDHAYSYFGGMMVYDNYAVAFNEVLIFIALGWFLLAPSFFDDENHVTDYFAVVLFALAGALVMTSYNHLVMLFLGIEILSISMYVMAGSRKTDLKSNEAALKYFLMGAFATGFLLFGITLVYGATGNFNTEVIRHYVITHQGNLPALFNVGILLIMVGLVFKISAFPFHFWAPDVYEGSPTAITAFMATIVKVAAVAAFYRLFSTCFSMVQGIWVPALWVISAATILVGNFTALFQKDLKRMLAYSSISHAGYILFAILAMNSLSTPSLLYYSVAYSFATLSAFAIIIIVSQRMGNTQIDSLKGLAKQNPFMALVLVVSMFSLAGIPPLAGFFAKYYLFAAAIQSHLTALVLLALIGTLVGVYYYFRVVVTIFQDGPEQAPYQIPFTNKVLFVLSLLITIILGVLPNLLVRLW